MIEIEPDERPDISSLDGPESARGRLYEWARARHWPELNVWPPESPMYAVLHNPGRATNVQSDGGMADNASRYSAAMAVWVRVVEVGQALDQMPRAFRLAVHAMYRVEKRERPRRIEEAAQIAGMPVPTFRKTMDHALVWLQGRLCLGMTRGENDRGLTDLISAN